MGHQHLGFAEADLRAEATAAGLDLLSYRALPVAPEALGPGLFVAVFGAAPR